MKKISEQTARVILNWMAEQFRVRARSELGAEFPAETYTTGFGGDVNLKNTAEPLYFHVHVVVSTKEQPAVEFAQLVRSSKMD